MERVPEPELMDLPDEAAAYAAADFSTVNAAFVQRLLELADTFATARAIDLGTGPGEIAIRVAAERPGWRIDAVDAAPAMIEIARQSLSAAHARQIGGALAFHLADATRTNLASAGYDVVFSNSLLHHMPDPLPLWREIRRLAKPGAVVFVRDLVRPTTPAAARAIVDQHAGGESKLLQDEFYRSLLAAFTVAEVEAQLAAAGLASLKVEQVTDRHLDVHGILG